MLRSGLREGEIVGRYGGEEFVVLLPGAVEPDALERAETLRRGVAGSPAVHEDLVLRTTVSVGVSFGRGEGLELEALLGQADEALYFEGRDRILVLGEGWPREQRLAG